MDKKDINFEVIYKNVISSLRPEKSFYLVALIYGAGVSLLTLAIPISVQSLVNTVSFGVLVQPLVILSIILLLLLIFSGFLKGLQTYIIELYQRKFYTRITCEMVENILGSHPREFQKTNGVELTNRYFDIMTVHKNVAKLLMDGFSVFLSGFVGLLLLAFYHPYFLIFDIILAIMLWLVWAFYGKVAIASAISESTAKYKVAHWMQEISRENFFFKSEKRKEYAKSIADEQIINYIDKRKKHFNKLFYQIIFLLIIYAFMSSLILALGGYLVIKGELTIGQLVASELIITIILSSIAKSGKYLESFYDLVAGVMKISQFYSLEMEDHNHKLSFKATTYDLSFEDVLYRSEKYEFFYNFNLSFGNAYHLKAHFNSSKAIFINLLRGIQEPNTGSITFGDISIYNINPDEFRDLVYIVDKPIIFSGSVYENLICSNSAINKQQINQVLEIVELEDIETIFDDGLNTQMLSSGFPLWSSQLIRFEIAKAILHKPKVLILTDIIDQIQVERRNKILDYIRSLDMTLIILSGTDSYSQDIESIDLSRKIIGRGGY